MNLNDGSVLTFDRIKELEDKVVRYRLQKEGNIFDLFYNSDLAVIDTAIELLKKRLECDVLKEDWVNSFEEYYQLGKATKEVIIFIANILFKNGYYSEEIRNLFARGYCYHLAGILKETFKRGNITVAGPYSHVVWEDVDGCTYDIDGVYKDYEFLVPIDEVSNRGGFAHIPTEAVCTSKEELEYLRNKYTRPTFGYGMDILRAAASTPCNTDMKYEDKNRDIILRILSILWQGTWSDGVGINSPVGALNEISLVGKMACGYSSYKEINVVILFKEDRFREESKSRMETLINEVRSRLKSQFDIDLNASMHKSLTDEDARFDSNVTMYHEWHEVIYKQ